MNEFMENVKSLSKEEREKLIQILNSNGAEYNVYPLSAEQSRMWYMYKLNPKDTFYNVSFGIRFKGTLDLEKLNDALNNVEKDQKVLTSKIITISGQVFVHVEDKEKVKLNVVQCNNLTDVYNILKKQNENAFDLENEYPIRMKLCKISDRDYVLCVTIHHMFCDGWSIGVFKDCLENNYKGLDKKNNLQYTDYAIYSSGRDKKEDKNFWLQKLDGANFSAELPVSYGPVVNEDNEELSYKMQIDNYESINEFCKKNKISVFSFFLSVYGLMLQEYSKEDDIVIGTPVLNRNEVKWTDIIGYFSNSIPIRIKFNKHITVMDYLKVVWTTVLDSINHGEYQFGQLVEDLNIKRIINKNPIFQTIFSMHSEKSISVNNKKESSELEMSVMENNNSSKTQFTLLATLIDDNENYSLLFEAQKSRFHLDKMKEMGRIYSLLVKEVINNSNESLNEFLKKHNVYDNDSIRLEKYEKAFMEDNNIDNCAIYNYRDFCFIYYETAKNKNLDVTSISNTLSSNIITVKLNGISESKDLLKEYTINLTRKIRKGYYRLKDNGNVKNVYLVNEGVLEEKTYYDIKDLDPNYEKILLTDMSKKKDSGNLNNEISLLDGGSIKPSKMKNLRDLLLMMDEDNKEKVITIIDNELDEKKITYRELINKAKKVASNLQEKNLNKSDKILLQIADSEKFLVIFWGCIFAGVTAIPLSPAYDEAGKKRLDIISSITHNPYVVISNKENLDIKQDKILIAEELMKESNYEYNYENEIDSDFIAMIMFTSGSTGLPKGVLLPHKNVLNRTLEATEFLNLHSNDNMLNWMPLDHVGGIIMAHMQAIGFQGAQEIVNTKIILSKPSKWLEYLSRFKATSTWAPNFAFGLLLDVENEIKDMNISLENLKVIENGGEAINYNSCEKFMNLMRSKGLKHDAMIPAWGMTETCSGVLYSRRFGDVLDKNSVAVGKPIPGIKVRIVDEDGNIVPKGEKGDLQISGNTVLNEYFELPEENNKAFTKDGWFITGDCAIIKEDEILITGRTKEIMIINGKNISCLEVEKNLEEIEELQTGTVGCSAIKNEETSEDEVCIFYGETSKSLRNFMKKKISYELSKNFGFTYDYLIPIAIDEMPRSSIGKIEKKLLVKEFKEGKIKSISINKNTSMKKWFSKVVNYNKEPNKVIKNKVDLILYDDKYKINALTLGNLLDTSAKNISLADNISKNVLYIMDTIENIDNVSLAAEVMEKINNVVSKISKKAILSIIVKDNKDNNEMKSIINGYCASIAQEYDNCYMKVIYADNLENIENIKLVIDQYLSNSKKFEIVNCADNEISHEVIESFDILKNKIERTSFKPYGTYLLIGGIGGIGREIASYLLKKYNCNLIITGRKDEKDYIYVLDELRKNGSVTYKKCDISKKGNCTDLLKNVFKEFENIDGIFGLIGDISSKEHFAQYEKYSALNLDKDEIYKSALPRIILTQEIDEFLKDKEGLDVIIFTSATALMGGKTYGVYSAVSRYILDYKWKSKKNNFFIYAWSKWKNIGMSSGETLNEQLAAERAGYFIVDVNKGITSLEALIKRNINKAVIGLDLLNSNIQEFSSVYWKEQLSSMNFVINYEAKEPVKYICEDNMLEAKWVENNSSGVESCVNDTEEKMLSLWKEVLNNNSLSVTDDFFEAGGNSLMIIKLLDKVNEEFKCQLSIVDLFNCATVRKLSNYIKPQNEDENSEDIEIITI